MKQMELLTNFYNSYDEDSRLKTSHGSVEFLTTMRYIYKYIKEGDRIAEIGAGTGRYSHELARRGWHVDAVEPVAHNIEIFKSNTLPSEKITITQGNATDLASFPDNFYDITLLLGPMYHLHSVKDKQAAISEALRITRPDGKVFAAYVISDGCLLHEGFRHKKIDVAEYLRTGLLDADTFASVSNPEIVFELVRKEDIDYLMQPFPVKRLHYFASDGPALLLREEIDKMDEHSFHLFLKYHFAVCERPDMLGYTCHSVDVFQKLQD